MNKIIFIVIFLMISSILAASVLSLYDKIYDIKISKINRQLFSDREELQSVKAQWNYVNNKEYLQDLVKKHLPQMRNLDLKLDVDISRLNKIPNKKNSN